MLTLCRWLAIVSLAVLSNGGSVQVPDLNLPSTAAARRQAVVDLFNVSYKAYHQYAWAHDELLSISKSYVDDLNGWGASVLDALDTMWLMGFHDWFKEAVELVTAVDFSRSRTNDTVSVFETTIQHVGGLLTAYELSGKQNYTLVQKAEEVTRQMAYAFTGDSPIPFNNINSTDHTPVKDLTLLKLVLLYAGNDTYRQLAKKSVQHLIHMPTVLPAMPALLIDPSTGKSSDTHVTWGGGCDSFYDARLINTDDNSYADAWLATVDTCIIEVILKEQVLHVGSHLACFYGGNWILGGKLTNNDTIFKIGLRLTDACWNTYASTATGIRPEVFAYVSDDGNATGQLQFYSEHGYYITESDYRLRPGVLESSFYAWRATGNTKYLDNAASAIRSFQKYLPGTVAYAGINDVDNATSSKVDNMSSFWFGEVLKYLCLTLDDPNNISLDEYVFNTECHPFKAPKAKSVYGSMLGY